MNNLALGIDLGGTHIKGALLYEGEIVDHYHTDTNDLLVAENQSSKALWKQAMRTMIDAARQRHPQQTLEGVLKPIEV